jgi:hypothetical protein
MSLIYISIWQDLQPSGRFLRTFRPAVIANSARLPAKPRPVDLSRHRAFLDLEQQLWKISGIAFVHRYHLGGAGELLLMCSHRLVEFDRGANIVQGIMCLVLA